MPCGHDKAEAIHVYAKNYGKGGEFVEIDGPGARFSVWIFVKPREPGVTYVGRPIKLVETVDGKINLWDWLSRFPAPVIRAFESRWSSSKFPPRWREIELWETRDNIDE